MHWMNEDTLKYARSAAHAALRARRMPGMCDADLDDVVCHCVYALGCYAERHRIDAITLPDQEKLLRVIARRHVADLVRRRKARRTLNYEYYEELVGEIPARYTTGLSTELGIPESLIDLLPGSTAIVLIDKLQNPHESIEKICHRIRYARSSYSASMKRIRCIFHDAASFVARRDEWLRRRLLVQETVTDDDLDEFLKWSNDIERSATMIAEGEALESLFVASVNPAMRISTESWYFSPTARQLHAGKTDLLPRRVNNGEWDVSEAFSVMLNAYEAAAERARKQGQSILRGYAKAKVGIHELYLWLLMPEGLTSEFDYSAGLIADGLVLMLPYISMPHVLRRAQQIARETLNLLRQGWPGTRRGRRSVFTHVEPLVQLLGSPDLPGEFARL